MSDIIFFVADEENTGIDPLDVSMSKPDRERQKLLREQNILKQVQYGGISGLELLIILNTFDLRMNHQSEQYVWLRI